MITSDGVRLGIRETGDADGVPLVLLSGGPACVAYLPDVPSGSGVRAFQPDPRGVGTSEGGPHDLARSIQDLEEIRTGLGVDRWVVAGHSAGADLGVVYALEHPTSITRVLAACGTGVQDDREWHDIYERLSSTEPALDLPYDVAVHRGLRISWREWIKRPDLLRRLGDLRVPVHFVVAEHDIRPAWPVAQVAALVPSATYAVIPDVAHDFWHTHPAVWHDLVLGAMR